MIQPDRAKNLHESIGYTDGELVDLREFWCFLKDVGEEFDYELLRHKASRNLSVINNIIDNRKNFNP